MNSTARNIFFSLVVAASLIVAPVTRARDDFNAVVKVIEQFYHVKHESIPLLARAAMKTARTAARVRGGDYKRLAEAGSVRIAFFEDQSFDSRGEMANFKSSLRAALGDSWSPVVRTLAPEDEEQTHVYLQQAGKDFLILVITIEKHEGAVIQAKVAPETLSQLMRDPNEIGRALAREATNDDK
jgi:hypothetical protein